MRASRSIIRRRGPKKLDRAFELQLTSMMDMLIIIVVFLLKSYTTSQNNLSSVKGIEIPYSASAESARDHLQVIISLEGIHFENELIVNFNQQGNTPSLDSKSLDEKGLRIIPLYDALVKAKEKAEALRTKSQARDEKKNPLPFDGVIAIQSDRRIPYQTVKKILYTAGAAGYRNFKFLAQKREG